MEDHDKMLPRCREREAANTVILLDLQSKVSDMHEIVTGNGNPGRGLVFRLVSIEQTLRSYKTAQMTWKKRIWQFVGGAALVLFGYFVRQS